PDTVRREALDGYPAAISAPALFRVGRLASITDVLPAPALAELARRNVATTAHTPDQSRRSVLDEVLALDLATVARGAPGWRGLELDSRMRAPMGAAPGMVRILGATLPARNRDPAARDARIAKLSAHLLLPASGANFSILHGVKSTVLFQMLMVLWRPSQTRRHSRSAFWPLFFTRPRVGSSRQPSRQLTSRHMASSR